LSFPSITGFEVERRVAVYTGCSMAFCTGTVSFWKNISTLQVEENDLKGINKRRRIKHVIKLFLDRSLIG
jgi:hypothetical protein